MQPRIVGTVLGYSRRSIRFKSSARETTTVDSETQRKRDYLRTMLGKDMAGERYLTRLVTAATAEHHNQERQQQQQQQQPYKPAPARVAKGSVSLSSQTFNVPVLSVDWNSPMERIKADLDAVLAENIGSVGKEIVLDLSTAVTPGGSTMAAIIAIKEHLSRGTHSAPISISMAINCADQLLTDAVRSAGLSVSHGWARGKSICDLPLISSVSQAPLSQPLAPKARAAANVHHGTVRSGQQIYAEGCSLIIVGSVNDGAEVLADGDIHVYGALKGRAMAGLGGSLDARVFAHYFSPSLVGITDVFAISDDYQGSSAVVGKPVSVRLIKKDEVASATNEGIIVDCGTGRLMLNVLPLKE